MINPLAPQALQLLLRTGSGESESLIRSPENGSTLPLELAWAVARDSGFGANIPITSARGASNRLVGIDLGYTWSEPLYGMEPFGVRRPVEPVTDRGETGSAWPIQAVAGPGENVLDVLVEGPTTEHQIKIDLEAGGIIDSWEIDTGSVSGEFINRGGRLTRGFQAGAYWTDPASGDFRYYCPRQGGDRFTENGNLQRLFGGRLKRGASVRAAEGGTEIEVEVIPVEYDPDGFLAVPGLTGGHGGAEGQPILWTGIGLTRRIVVNWRGIENVHLVETTWRVPVDVRSAFFPMSAYEALFLDPTLFSRVMVYSANLAAEQQLAGSVVGNPGFQSHDRVYYANKSGAFGDDESIAVLGNVTGNVAVVAGAGPSDGDLAVGLFCDTRLDNVLETDKTLNDGAPTGWTWSQKRDGTSGKDGSNNLAIGAGRFLSGRLHPYHSVRRIMAGEIKVRTFLMTDSWTNMKQAASNLFSVLL